MTRHAVLQAVSAVLVGLLAFNLTRRPKVPASWSFAIQQRTQALCKKTSSQTSSSKTIEHFNHPQVEESPYYHRSSSLCQLVPAEKSTVWLWQTSLDLIAQATAGSRDDLSDLIDLQDAVDATALERAVKGRPMPEVWGHFMHKIQVRKQQPDMAGKVRILILQPQSKSTTSSMLSDLLDSILTQLLGEDVIEIETMALPDASTELYTHLIESNSVGTFDLVVHALSRSDMQMPVSAPGTTHDQVMIQSYTDRLFAAQNFLRAALQSQPCAEHQPVVLFLDDYIDLASTLYDETVQNRVLQQLADYYRVAFVSYRHVVQLFLQGSKGSREVWLDSALANVAKVWSLLYSWLDYTVEFCSLESELEDIPRVPFVQDWVWERFEYLPPFLDASLKLDNVSPRWQQEQERQEQRRASVCEGEEHVVQESCPFAFYYDQGDALPIDWHESGWQITSDSLHGSKEGATVRLQFDNLQVDYAKLFVRSQSHSDVRPLVEWTIRDKSGASINQLVSSDGPMAIPDQVALWNLTVAEMEFQVQVGNDIDIVGLFLCKEEASAAQETVF